MYFFVFAPLLEDKKVINESNFFAFSRLIKKDPSAKCYTWLESYGGEVSHGKKLKIF